MRSAPEMASIHGRKGASTAPRPAAPAAAAKPNGRQQAMQETAEMTAATGASFSKCFNYSVGTANVPTKPLRCMWLLQVSPSALPV